MNQTVQIAHNAVAAKLVNPTPEIRNLVNALLSYKVEGAEYSSAYGSGGWNGMSTFFSYANDQFPAGFVPFIRDELAKRSVMAQIIRKPLPEPRGPVLPIVDEFGHSDARYDYQMEAVNRLVHYGSGIAQVATGGGKSRICRLAYARIARPTLFLTTRSVLADQMKDAFEETFETDVAMMGDGQFGVITKSGRKINKLTNFTVAMVQTLASWLEDPDPKQAPEKQMKQAMRQKQMKEILSRFEFVVIEEAHEVSGAGFYRVMNACVNAHYRLALTATPFMKGATEDNMRLMAVSGQVFIHVTEQMLIERGILATPYFKYISSLPKPGVLRRTTGFQKAYKEGISENVYRNQAILYEAKRARDHKLPVIVLVGHKRHGELLNEMMCQSGVQSEWIYGESSKAERKAALGRLKSGETQALIGSTIMDVGVDVPAVGMVILAGGGKAEVALRQRVGRGLRAKKGANVCFIVDFCDEHNVHLQEHAAMRIGIIRATPGFAENILPNGADFDYSKLSA